MRDLYHGFSAALGLQAGAKAKSGSPFEGPTIDLQGFEGALVIAAAGALGTEINTYAFGLTESDEDDSGFAPVDPGDILGTPPVFEYGTAGDPDESGDVKAFGYVGSKRYLRLTLDVAGAGTGSGIVGAVIVRGFPRHAPAV
jgi:hypothetical protein